jgi:hypothetical protein
VKGFVDEVAIICGADEIARHSRIYGRGQFVFDPKHYLALLEQKPGALDQAAPLQSWTLPEPLQHLRRLLEVRMGNRGKREFVQVLRLMEIFPESIVAAATTDAISSTKPPPPFLLSPAWRLCEQKFRSSGTRAIAARSS